MGAVSGGAPGRGRAGGRLTALSPPVSAVLKGALRVPSALMRRAWALFPETQYRWPFVGCCVSQPTWASSGSIPTALTAPSLRLRMTMPALSSVTITLP